MSLNCTPETVITDLASRARASRLALNLTQEGLAERAGISLGSLRVFERSGKISLKGLLKIALVLDGLDKFAGLFSQQTEPQRLDDLLKKDRARQRGRIK